MENTEHSNKMCFLKSWRQFLYKSTHHNETRFHKKSETFSFVSILFIRSYLVISMILAWSKAKVWNQLVANERRRDLERLQAKWSFSVATWLAAHGLIFCVVVGHEIWPQLPPLARKDVRKGRPMLWDTLWLRL